jgi:hypothetical protein
MPTLDWIGKKAVLNHHNEVPFHLLKEETSLSVGDRESGAAVWKSGFDFTTAVKWSNDFFLKEWLLNTMKQRSISNRNRSIPFFVYSTHPKASSYRFVLMTMTGAFFTMGIGLLI